MVWVDLLGAALTLLAVALLGLGGYLLAVTALGEEGRRDALALAVTALTATVAEATGIGLLLGALGLLRIELALALAAALAALLLARLKRQRLPAGVGAPGRHLLARSLAGVRRHPALALIAFHAGASEALRGLLRPPLSWDSLTYHLLLAATWLQEKGLGAVFGRFPVNFYGYSPGNGEVWLWWWLAPSHGELYANLAFVAQWLLLALAAGGVARELGARRSWPLASLVLAVVPTVVRFVATQYVDVQVGALVCAAAFFGLRWMGEARLREALLAGAALGLAAGTKVLGLGYAVALGLAVVAAARGGWGRRLAQAAGAAGSAAFFGSFFYLRNLALGVGPLAVVCAAPLEGAEQSLGSTLLSPHTVAALWRRMLADGTLVDAFLGVTRPPSLELGLGPLAVLLLAASLALPFVLEKRAALVVGSQIAVQLALWVTVPFASHGHVFANVRYLIGAAGLALAAAVALAERRGVPERWQRWIAIALAVQSLLQLHAEMPRQVRLALAAADLAAVALALSAGARALVRRRWRPLAAVALAAAVLAAPRLALFRQADRARAFAEDLTVHLTPARLFAGAWAWLDAYGGDGTVAVVMEPGNRFIYPDMGPRYERRVVYVNVNAADHRNAGDYPACNPRVDPSAAAWLANLARSGARWVHLARQPEDEFPLELGWIEARPERFALRYEDPGNRIYEVLPAAGGR
jgi:hypothetical protein